MIWVYECPRFGGLDIMMIGGRMIKKRHKVGLKTMIAYRRLGIHK
jgi:hypothetical protein